MTDYSQLPEHMQDAAQRYIENGIRPGSFLTAVLENNLFRTVNFADETNRQSIGHWVLWLTWEIPAPAWGSKEKVDAWIKQGGLKGMNND